MSAKEGEGALANMREKMGEVAESMWLESRNRRMGL
jgi:hypothetical protein